MGELFFKKSIYVGQDNKEKTATNLFVKIGNYLIPVEIKYFPNKETNIDPQYSARKAVFLSQAKELTD